MSADRHARPWLLIPFLAGVGLVAWFASQFRPGAWYQALDQPPWTPPDWLFGPVWTVLYVTIAVAGWLIFSRGTPPARMLWSAQLLFNGLWSWLFFGEHRVALALADITVLVACIAALLAHLAPRQPAVFYLLLPYGLWVSYAWTLNAGVLALN